MKKWQKTLVLILAVVMVVGLSSAALAASVTKKQLTAEYSGIQITLDGQKIEPKDANGTIVEPFIVDGTTYLPVRALSNALGLDVDWDQTTQTVVLTTPKEEQTGADVLKQYVESEEFQLEAAGIISTYEEMGIKLSVSVSSEQLVYTCTFTEQLDNSDGSIGEAFMAALDEQASIFENIANQLKAELGITNASVLVEYFNADGSEIASKIFYAE